MKTKLLNLTLICILGFIKGGQLEWNSVEQTIFQNPVRFVKTKAADISHARQPEYLITDRIDYLSRDIVEMEILSINGIELYSLDIDAQMGGYYDGIYTTLADPAPNAYENENSPDLNIYRFDGSVISSTVFNDEQTRLITVFGMGQYIGFNPFNGMFHIVNPVKGLYNKFLLTKTEIHVKEDRYLYSTGSYLLDKQTGLFYFIISIYNQSYSILINDNCELLWQKYIDQRVTRQTFSDKGNFLSMFVGDTPSASHGDMITFDLNGNLVSRISGISAGGYPIEIFEDYELLVVHDSQKTWVCNFKTGAVINEYPMGGEYLSYCPTKNYLVKAMSYSNQIRFSLFDMDDMIRIRSVSTYKIENPKSSILGSFLDFSISHDGTEISMVTNYMFCKIELKEN